MVEFRRIASILAATLPASALLVAPTCARADFYLHHWQNQHGDAHALRLDLDAGYYQTGTNYDVEGNPFVPGGLDKYARIQTDALGAYGLTTRLTAFGRLGWARAQLDSTTSLLQGASFGFTDATLGLNYRVFEFQGAEHTNGAAIDLQLQGDFPLYTNQGITGPSLGDGTIDVTGGAFFSLPALHTRSGTLVLTAGGGYTYRNSDYSSALPWSVTAEYEPKFEGFYASIAALGIESLKTDPRGASITATTPATSITSAAGGSFVSGAANPSLFTVRGELGYRLSPDVGAGIFASQSVWGQGAPSGFFAGIALRTHFGSHASSIDSAKLSPRDYGHANEGFVGYTMEAHVTRVNDRLNLLKIDKGSQDNVEVGQTFDIFSVKKDGSVGEAVARCKVTNVKSGEAALSIEEYFKEIWIDEGFIAKRPVQ